MTDGQIIYSVGRDMTKFEMQMGFKPDAVLCSEAIYRTLAESRWLIAHKVERNSRITADDRLLGASLFMVRNLEPEMYIVGMKCVLEKQRHYEPKFEPPDREGDI